MYIKFVNLFLFQGKDLLFNIRDPSCHWPITGLRLQSIRV